MHEVINKEPELPPKMHITVADDDPRWRSDIARSAQALNTNYTIEAPGNVRELFDRSLYRYPLWIPTDVVLLDNNYERDRKNWNPEHLPYLRNAKQKMLKIGINPIAIDALIYGPSAYTFALLLRLHEFKGRVFCISGDTPTTTDLNAYLDITRRFEPILNGAVLKKPFGGTYYIDQYILKPSGIEIEMNSVPGTMTDAIRTLLLST